MEKQIEVSVDTLTTETAEMVLTSVINNIPLRRNEYLVAEASIKLLVRQALQLPVPEHAVPELT